jgi:putative endonuclease
LRCRNGEFYTGYTNDPVRRIRLHNAGSASKFTRSRRPVELVYLEKSASRSAALRREAQIKKLRRRDKRALCEKFARTKKLTAV